ncbi:thiolase family protein [Tabrizicola piscis]|uniref:Thiolase family protein n=1 Tax=Tabrizicola piscis TaxID=2494374 RepID=A0A3S8U4F7_9RHOB|nr:thiolase family protein [Tabrizicola piscis]AZL58512.1 thiolase family protein [Tabrizicola piscis]
MARLIAARRTAVVPRGGAFARLSIEDLASPVLLACLADAGIRPDQVDEVILANALGAGGNPARRVALAAGLGHVPGLTIDRQCAGGLDAILLARALVDSGAADVVVAGGVESTSRRPLRLRTDPEGGLPVAYDQAPFTPWPDRDPGMADAAEALAQRLGISRAAQEAWALESHAKALKSNHSAEIVPLAGVTQDAFPRRLSPGLLARAPIVAGSITAATAAVAADAAAVCLVVSDRIAQGRGLAILNGATVGGNPEEPGLAPLAAIQRLWQGEPLAMAEIMEAYAVQAIAVVKGAGLDPALVNPGGGALARGHPIGASGAILAVRLFHGLQSGRGLAAIASAGGIGTALLVDSSGA